MNLAIRSVSKSYTPSLLSLFPPPPQSLRPVGQNPCAVRVRQVSGLSSQPERGDNADSMDKREEDATKTRDGDVMSLSFGEGYSTRSDEEGFGGTYGRNQTLFIKDEGDIHEDYPDYDESQGSEVKEKERARNQKSASS